MKIIYPDYYKNFNCIADRCEDTCCAGWEIVVDSASASLYKTADGSIGDRLRCEMKTDCDGDIVFALDNGRCPFLNQRNLCDIYSELGEDSLCRTCKMFPRFIEEYGATRETGLGLACPEAARIIVNYKGERVLLSEINDEVPLPNDIDPETYFNLLSLRKQIFSVIDDSSLPFESRLLKMLEIAGENDATLPHINDCIKILSSLDILTHRWQSLISGGVVCTDFSQKDNELANIAWYYIYRYFLKSVFDGDVITKVKLCVFACTVINAFSYKENIADIAHLFSKEVEYSADNIETVYRQLKNQGR